MNKVTINNHGFTLIEIIMSIVIITILGYVAGMGLVEIGEYYSFSKKNATLAQQGQIATTRLKKELSSSGSIICGGPNMITYTIQRSASEGVDVSSIYLAGGDNRSCQHPPCIFLKTASTCTVCTSSCADGDTLADNVSDFTLSYCTTTASSSCSATFQVSSASLVKITLKVKGYDNQPMSIVDDVVFLGQESGR
jgi:prepilin-type N-terminal cleavage/methylation domain-containing protein